MIEYSSLRFDTQLFCFIMKLKGFFEVNYYSEMTLLLSDAIFVTEVVHNFIYLNIVLLQVSLYKLQANFK